MAEENEVTNNETEGRHISVAAQYVKDLSFENPGAPQSLMEGSGAPKIDIGVDVRAGAVGTDLYDVSLTLSCKATRDDNSLFVCELTYGGLFTLKNIPENEREPALLIFCPSLLFPFARRIIADTTRDGGFPPLMLDPFDFGRLYASRQQQQAA